MGHDLLDRPLSQLFLILAKMYLPFLVFGGTFHLVYRFVMPPLLARLSSAWQRAALHAAAIACVTLAIGLALVELLERISQRPIGVGNFLIVSLIFSCACLLPALGIQQLRVRAQRAEHATLVERKAAL